MLELNKEYTYPQICGIVGWELKAGNSKKAQIREIESAYDFYHPINTRTHKAKKSYIFTKKIRDLVEPSKSNCGGAHNTKNIQPMVEYLRIKYDLDGEWHSFTDWYCTKLGLMYKETCNAPYDDGEMDAVCGEYGISDSKLFCEYVSAAKSELKNMFLKALAHMQRQDTAIYFDEVKFVYRLGKKATGNVITGCVNDTVERIETDICNNMNEEYNLSRKMKGRQLLRVIYSNEGYREEFKKFCLFVLNEDGYALKKLNDELSNQHETFLPNFGSICSSRPLTDYHRGIRIAEMEPGDGDIDALAMDVTNRIRGKVRKLLRKNYRKFVKQSDMISIEKALFQHYDENYLIENGITGHPDGC